MSFIDAVEMSIRMTKGEGDFPDLSDLNQSEIEKLIVLSIDNESLKGFGYTHYRIINSGEKSSTILIKDGVIEGYPTLEVRLYAYPDFNQLNVDVFGDDLIIVSECFSYRVERDDCEFFFVDMNGYTEVRRISSEMMPPEDFDKKLRTKSIAL